MATATPDKLHKTRIGLISDTHNLLRPEARDFLRGSDHIIHAGDVCDPRVLEALAELAPVTAVRGNNDRGSWAERLHEVSGHSHKPLIEQRDGIFYVNPGSAGPRRFKLPIAVGEIVVEGGSVSARIVEVPVANARA